MIKNIENSTLALRTIANKSENILSNVPVLISTADLLLTPIQWRSKITNNIIEDLPNCLKVLLGDDNGCLSVKKFDKLIEFMKNSPVESLKKAGIELKETGKTSSLGSKVDFINYKNFKSFQNQYDKNINLNFNVLARVKREFQLSDKQMQFFFPPNSSLSISNKHYLIDKLLPIVEDREVKKNISEIFIKDLLKEDEYIEEIIQKEYEETLKSVIKVLNFVGNDLKQDFISKIPDIESLPEANQFLIGQLLNDSAKKAIINNFEISSYVKKEFLDLVKTIKDPDILTNVVDSHIDICCEDDFFKALINKNPEILKKVYYAAEQKEDYSAINSISSEVLKNLFNDGEKIDIIKRMTEKRELIPDSLVESIQDYGLQKKVILENALYESNYPLIKENELRDELTFKLFDKLKQTTAGYRSSRCEKMLKSTLNKTNDQEYIQSVVNYISELVNPAEKPMHFEDLSFLNKIKDEKVLDKIISLIDNKSFYYLENKGLIKQLLKNIQNSETKSKIAGKLLQDYKSNEFSGIKNYSYIFQHLNDDKLKIDFLKDSIIVLSLQRIEKNIYIDLISTVKSLSADSKTKEYWAKQVAGLRKNIKDEAYINFAKHIKNNNPEKYNFDDVYAYIASNLAKESGIAEDDIINFIHTTNKPEELIKILSETRNFKLNILNNSDELLLNDNRLRPIFDAIKTSSCASGSFDLMECLELLKNLEIDLGLKNLRELLSPKIKENIRLEIEYARNSAIKRIEENNIKLDEMISDFISSANKQDIPDKMLEFKTMIPGFDDAFAKVAPQLDSDLLSSIYSKLQQSVSIEEAINTMGEKKTVKEFIDKYRQFNINSQFSLLSLDNSEHTMFELQELLLTENTGNIFIELLKEKMEILSEEHKDFNVIRFIGLGNTRDLLKKSGLSKYFELSENFDTFLKSISYTNANKLEKILSAKGTSANMAKDMITILQGYKEFDKPVILENAIQKIIDKQKENIPIQKIHYEAKEDFFKSFIQEINLSDEYIEKIPQVMGKWDMDHFPELSSLYKNSDEVRKNWLKQLISSTFDTKKYTKILGLDQNIVFVKG